MKQGRPAQPKCPSCGKALYKHLPDASLPKGKYTSVKKADPYAFCRNVKCELHGDIRQTKLKLEPAHKDAKAKAKPKRKRTRAKPKQTHKQKPLCEDCGRLKCVCEPEMIKKARVRIRNAIGGGDHARNAIGLALAIVAQEMGSNDVASKLIKEFNLTELYGIQPVE